MNDNYWYIEALCRDKSELFDATEDDYGKDQYPRLDEAQAICAECPVSFFCDLEGRHEPTGIWAGTPRTGR